ncbi:LptF/LptG family permease [Halosquirtibacter xylanolyticus]|uniref:LptF/LptG family permease n=1 Tax=Halosquirtibacter xylanolyticus TaxID=3374599 RepID=UPI003748CEFF|nr:LptF/LptG family permease [Prolixibacteraceae bacterium]
MKRLHRYLLQEFVGPFVMTFFICSFVLFMQFMWRYLEDIVGKGLEWPVLVEIVTYIFLSMVPMSLPLAMLIASIMTLGNMGERNELLAMKAAGISQINIFKPLILISIVISIGAFSFSNYALPVVNRKLSILLYSVKQTKPELLVKPGAFTNNIPGYRIKVKDKRENGALIDVMIYDHSKRGGNVNITLADSAYMGLTEDKLNMRLTLFNGETYEEKKPESRKDRENKPFTTMKFAKQTYLIPLDGMQFQRKDENLFKNSYHSLPMDKLEYMADSIYIKANDWARDKTVRLNLISPLVRSLAYVNYPDTVKLRVDKPVFQLDSVLVNDSILNRAELRVQKMVMNRAIEDVRSNQRSLLRSQEEITGMKVLGNKYIIQWHNKIVLSVACLLFFLIGAPLGSIIRKGGMGLPLVISIILFIIYYIIGTTLKKAAQAGNMPIWEAMWLSTFIYLPAGLLLTYVSANDSSRFNFSLIFKPIINIFKKRVLKSKKTSEDSKEA